MSENQIPSRCLEGIRYLLPGVPLEKIRVRRGTWMGRLFGRFGQQAVTFGTTIHLTPRAPLDQGSDARYFALLAHECYHVKQYASLGLVPFLMLYVMARIAIFALRRPVGDHPMEMPAYDIQRLATEWWEANHPGDR